MQQPPLPFLVSDTFIDHAGDVLEQAVFLSIQMQDDRAFERNYDQLKSYYTDTGCSASPNPVMIISCVLD